MGFAVTAAGIGGQVLVQSAIHDEMRGRVMGLWGIICGGADWGRPAGCLNSWLGFGMVTVTVAFLLCWLMRSRGAINCARMKHWQAVLKARDHF